MNRAVLEAEIAKDQGCFPTSSVLTSNKKILFVQRSFSDSYLDSYIHPEAFLIGQNILELRYLNKNENNELELYNILEPCLPCTELAAKYGIKKIHYSCPDPYNGAAKTDTSTLPAYYQERWPIIKQSSNTSKSYNLIIDFMKNKPQFQYIYEMFKEMHDWNMLYQND